MSFKTPHKIKLFQTSATYSSVYTTIYLFSVCHKLFDAVWLLQVFNSYVLLLLFFYFFFFLFFSIFRWSLWPTIMRLPWRSCCILQSKTCFKLWAHIYLYIFFTRIYKSLWWPWLLSLVVFKSQRKYLPVTPTEFLIVTSLLQLLSWRSLKAFFKNHLLTSNLQNNWAKERFWKITCLPTLHHPLPSNWTLSPPACKTVMSNPGPYRE